MENVMEVKNLNLKYPNFSLKDVNFSIPEGAVAGFIGLNGQGKTTTIRSILGLTKNDAKVKILGMDLKKMKRR